MTALTEGGDGDLLDTDDRLDWSAMAICWILMTALTEVGDGDLLDTDDRLD